MGIALFVYDPIGVLTPLNPEARALLGGSFENPTYRPKMKTVVIWAVATLWFGGLGIVNITGDDFGIGIGQLVIAAVCVIGLSITTLLYYFGK